MPVSTKAALEHWHRRALVAEGQATALRQEVRRLEDVIARLRAGLYPFARFAEKWDAKPLGGIDDEFYCIHAGADRASLRVSDCRRALAVLKGGDA